MKKSLILVFALFCFSSYSQQEWELIHGSTSSFNLSDVFISDAGHTWGIIGGLIYFSDDGGYNWDLQYSHADYHFSDVFFLNNQLGWVVGWSEVLKTVDGGENWTPQYLPNPLGLDVEAVYFLNADTGWIAGSYKTIYVTYDGGNSWTSQHNYNLNSFWLYDIYFVDPDHGCAVGGGMGYSPSVIMTTEDGGTNWNDVTPGNYGQLVNVVFTSEFQAWTCSSEGNLLTSYDRGFTWEVAADIFNIYPEDMHFFDDSSAIILGGHNMALTNDMWSTYQSVELMFTNTTLNFSFRNDQNGIAVGENNLLITSDGGYTWKRINERFTRIAFFNPMNGWALQEQLNKNMMHSNDGGQSWSEVETGQVGSMSEIAFPSDIVGYALSDKLELLKTTDAGATWQLSYLPADTSNTGDQRFLIPDFLDMQFLDPDTGFISTVHGRLLKTVDGGMDWQEYHVENIDYVVDLDFINPGEGWLLSYDSLCGHTTDGGLTWNIVDIGTEGLSEIKFVDHQTGFITSRFRIFRTADGGHSWNQLPYFLNSPGNIEFYDSLNGWITDRANVYRTYDGGITWVDSLNLESSNYYDDLTDLFMIDSTIMWICTLDGRVFSFSGLQKTEEMIRPELISLYPNPVSDQLTIEFNNMDQNDLTIRIFSIDGKLMLNKQYAALTQKRQVLDLSGFSSGLYLLNCQGASVSKSYKLVKH